MGFPSSFTNAEENCPKYWPMQSCNSQHNRLNWSVEPRIQRGHFSFTPILSNNKGQAVTSGMTLQPN